jgi:hypothetical protein
MKLLGTSVTFRNQNCSGLQDTLGFRRRNSIDGFLIYTASMNEKPKRWEMAGSIGDLSARLGYDIRDIWMSGYSDEQINGVLIGEYTLSALWKMEPLGNNRTPEGQAILDKKRKT